MKSLRPKLFVIGCIIAGSCPTAWAASVALPFGQVQTGTISSVAQSNSYTFIAGAQDVVDFTIIAAGGNLSPKINLYSPTGADIAYNYNGNPFGCSGGSNLEMNNITLPVAGTYTVIIGDCGDTNTGNYSIFVQRTNDPAHASSLAFGQVQTGTIASVAQNNSYTFNANAKDVVNFTIIAANGKLSPKINLYSPTGADIAYNYNGNPFGCSGGSNLEMNNIALPAAGIYAVTIGDCSDTNTGSYTIFMQRTNNPAPAANLIFGGQPQTGTISSVAQSNSYTFIADAQDVVDFTIIATGGGSLSPKINLYSPTGADIAYNYNGNPFGCSGGSNLEMNNITLPVAGTYAVIIGDCSDINTGSYNLSAQCFGRCPAPSVFTLNPTSASVGSGATTGGIALTASLTTASWTAVSGPSWIMITSGASGTGNGTVAYSVAPNNSVNSRNGTMTIAGITFPVVQAGATPSYALSASSTSVGAATGTGTLSVIASPADAPWSAISNATFLTITAGATGVGSGTVTYSFGANTLNSVRSGTLTVAGLTFTVNQAGTGTATKSIVLLTRNSPDDTVSYFQNLLTSAGLPFTKLTSSQINASSVANHSRPN